MKKNSLTIINTIKGIDIKDKKLKEITFYTSYIMSKRDLEYEAKQNNLDLSTIKTTNKRLIRSGK